MFNRIGEPNSNNQWTKGNDAVESVDINLYWPIYKQILEDEKI